MNFEWDEAKRLANLAKHGIDFLYAVELFALPTSRSRRARPRARSAISSSAVLVIE